jgi:Negative regulator of sigma F
VKDREIDEAIERAACDLREMDPDLLGRVASSMSASLRPVRPVAPAWMLASWLLAISVILAVAAAWWLGFSGFQKLDVVEIGSIFPALAIFIWLAALLCVAEMTPGGLRWKNPVIMQNPGILLLVVLVIWIAIVSVFFRDYDMGAFVPQGMGCLRAGLLVAIPAGAGSWLVLRRGFAVSPLGAGLAAGMLAGLAGLLMLELHCPNLRAPHVMVWHTAVIPVSALAGGVLAVIKNA